MRDCWRCLSLCHTVPTDGGRWCEQTPEQPHARYSGVIRRNQEARSEPPAPHHCGAVLSVADTVRLPHPLAHGAHVESLLQLRTSRRDLPRLPDPLSGVRCALFLHGQPQAVKQPHRLLPINSGHSTRESYIQGRHRKSRHSWSEHHGGEPVETLPDTHERRQPRHGPRSGGRRAASHGLWRRLNPPTVSNHRQSRKLEFPPPQ